MTGKILQRAIPLVIVLAGVGIAMLMVASRETLEAGDAEPLLPHVQTIAVELGGVPISIIAHGNVRARQELELASEVTGRVEWVAPEFQPGNLVTAGTVLLRVDPTLYRLALAEAKAALSSANNELADAKALKRNALIAESELKIEAARQRISKSEQDLAYTEIKAPFDAVIDTQLVEFGQYINAGRTVAHLLSSSSAEVSLPVTATDVGFIDPSASVILSARIGEQEQQWRGRILRIESRVDQLTRVIPVVVEVAAPYDPDAHAQRLPLGLFVKATLPGTPISAAVRLPRSVLQADDSLFVLADNALQRRRVDIAYREGNSIIVNGGLKTGDRVVATRLEVMFEGMKVKPVDA
jgi:RND family efflux transporter MFP subunit